MNRKRIYTSTAAALLLLFSACDMTGPETGVGSAPEGKAAVRIGIEGAGIQGRTILPSGGGLGDVTKWELWGGKPSESETRLKVISGTGDTVYLETGTWNFTLKGYNGTDDIILRGSITDKNITLEGPNNLSFTVAPVFEGTGTVKITVNLPPEHGITTAK
ncbi:MAG: hypothetical protein LBI85_00555, partial [Spirochaetaceae bacterium]|nr:hypothetical protein [Spirochaetaceae bacterium]